MMLVHDIYPNMTALDTSRYTTLMRDPNGSFSLGEPFSKTFIYFDEMKDYLQERGWNLSSSVTPEKIEYLKLNWLWRSDTGKVTIADSIPYMYSVPTSCMTL